MNTMPNVNRTGLCGGLASGTGNRQDVPGQHVEVHQPGHHPMRSIADRTSEDMLDLVLEETFPASDPVSRF